MNGSQVTVNRPSNTADNDLLVAAVYHRNTGRTITPPSGWSGLGTPDTGNATFGFWARPISSASGEPGTYQWNCDQSGRFLVAIIRVTDADLSNPLDLRGAVSG